MDLRALVHSHGFVANLQRLRAARGRGGRARVRHADLDEAVLMTFLSGGHAGLGHAGVGHAGVDVENMGYEDLLALGERIGNVKKGLSPAELDGIRSAPLRTRRSARAAGRSLRDEIFFFVKDRP